MFEVVRGGISYLYRSVKKLAVSFCLRSEFVTCTIIKRGQSRVENEHYSIFN